MSYAGNALAVAAKLAKKGQVVTLRKITTGDYIDGVVNTTHRDYARNGLVLDYGLVASGLVASGLVQQGDKQLYMESGVAPDLKDHVLIGGVAFQVVNIKELSPGGVVIMYELQLRRG